MNIIDYIQMGLLVLVVPALILVLVYIRRKDIKKYDEKIGDCLKGANPQPMQEYEKSGIKKSYVTSFVCGFFLIGILCTILEECVQSIVFSERIYNKEKVIVYSMISLAITVSRLVIGIIGPLLWIAWDKKRLLTRAELVKLPAYVHSTSSLSTSYRNRTAYLLYFDRKKGKLRTKTVTINHFEAANGRLHAGEFIFVVAEERKTKLRFVSALKKI